MTTTAKVGHTLARFEVEVVAHGEPALSIILSRRHDAILVEQSASPDCRLDAAGHGPRTRHPFLVFTRLLVRLGATRIMSGMSPATLQSRSDRVRRTVALALLLAAGIGGSAENCFGQTTTAASSNSTDVRPGVRVHSWFDSRQPGITPMIWVRVDKEWPMAAATRVAPVLKARPVGHRVLFFWHPFPEIDKRDLPKVIARGVQFDDRYYREFFRRLGELEAPVDRIVLDYEDGISLWHTIGTIPDGRLRIDAAQRVLSNPAAAARLPEAVRRVTPEALASPHAARAAYEAWNDWAATELKQAIRSSLCDLATRELGYCPPTTNYGDIRPGFPIYDFHGWRLPDTAVGEQSSPSCYLGTLGNRYLGWKKDVRWNRFIDNLNAVRSASAKGPVVPWVSSPLFNDSPPAPAAKGAAGIDGDEGWLWEQMVRHMHATGVSEFLYWNPGPPYRSAAVAASEDALAARTFNSLSAAPLRRADWLPIPLDAGDVRTGDVVTRYEQFLQQIKRRP